MRLRPVRCSRSFAPPTNRWGTQVELYQPQFTFVSLTAYDAWRSRLQADAEMTRMLQEFARIVATHETQFWQMED